MLKRPARIIAGAALGLAVLLMLGQNAAILYTETLWFGELGFADTFWKQVWISTAVRAATGAVTAALVLLNLWIVVRQLGPVQLRRRYGNLEIAEQVPRSAVLVGVVLTAVLAGWWLSGMTFGGDAPLSVLTWLRREPWGVRDPLFGRDLSFFVFALPVYSRMLDHLLLTGLWCVLLAVIGYVLVGGVRIHGSRVEIDEQPRLHFAVVAALLILLFAARYWVGRYGILMDGEGFGGAIGYTDVHARLPAQRVLAVFSVGAAAALLYGAFRRVWWPPAVAVGVLLVASVVLGYLYPSVVQKLRVEPTQLERERPYIGWNLEFTRLAYGLDALDRIAFIPRQGRLRDPEAASSAVSRLPLWDPEPLQAGFEQNQSLRPYYEFPSVRFDRYGPPGEERQVAIAVREFSEQGLQPENRTWSTLHLDAELVRGLGMVATPVAEKTAEGDPVFWIKDLGATRHPEAPPDLELLEPTVYFGQNMEGFLVLDSPRDSTARPSLSGRRAGIALDSFLRMLAFAWRFNDRNLLFAGEVTDSSRVVFRRRVRDRVARIAPFIMWDQNVHPVVALGRLVWLVDGYTAATTFPIAAPRRIGGLGEVRYLRNAVKATVDAVTGQVALYALTEADPILESYRRIFPELVQPLASMPPELVGHLTYPTLYMQLQADVLKDYHVGRAETFFGGENRWQVPRDEQESANAPHRPIYLFARLPGEPKAEYLLMLPFIARDRQNMTALLAARNDPESYGELVLLELPLDRRITGPRQVQSLLEQDPDISSTLALLRTRMSGVDYGRLRIVPLDSALLYVQPIYLSATDQSIPQLTRVIVSDGSAVNMGATLADAIDGLYRDSPDPMVTPLEPTELGLPGPSWPDEALLLLEQAERASRASEWATFGERLRELRALLERAAREPS
ncbi:MAG: UPF0182 family protein [Longimicrobiales bacterium]